MGLVGGRIEARGARQADSQGDVCAFSPGGCCLQLRSCVACALIVFSDARVLWPGVTDVLWCGATIRQPHFPFRRALTKPRLSPGGYSLLNPVYPRRIFLYTGVRVRLGAWCLFYLRQRLAATQLVAEILVFPLGCVVRNTM